MGKSVPSPALMFFNFYVWFLKLCVFLTITVSRTLCFVLRIFKVMYRKCIMSTWRSKLKSKAQYFFLF